MRSVYTDNTLGNAITGNGRVGVHPLCHLKSDIPVSVPGEEPEQAPSVEQAIGDMMKILNPYPKELWGEIMGALVAYACRE